MDNVCDLTRTGLIFTRSQEGTQPGWLTQTGQTNGVFDTMCHHALFQVGELAPGEINRGLGSVLVIRQ